MYTGSCKCCGSSSNFLSRFNRSSSSDSGSSFRYSSTDAGRDNASVSCSNSCLCAGEDTHNCISDVSTLQCISILTVYHCNSCLCAGEDTHSCILIHFRTHDMHTDTLSHTRYPYTATQRACFQKYVHFNIQFVYIYVFRSLRLG